MAFLPKISADKLEAVNLRFSFEKGDSLETGGNGGGGQTQDEIEAMRKELENAMPPMYPGDPPEAEGGFTHYIEDLKPFAKNRLMSILKIVGTAVTGVVTTGSVAGWALPSYWVYIVVGIAGFIGFIVLGGGIGAAIVGIRRGINLLQIGQQLSDYNRTKSDPTKKNYDMEYKEVH